MADAKTNSLAEQIELDFLTGLKAKNDETLVAVLRLLKTAIKNAAINKKGELTEDEIQKVIASEVKKRQDAIALYQQGGRPELAAKEEKEMTILTKYLPEQLSEEEIKSLVRKVVSEVAVKDFGKVMGQVMAQVKGQADGALVSKLVKEVLEK